MSLFRNSGGSKTPKLGEAEQLVSPGELTLGPTTPKKPTRGIRAKVCAADWDGDGKLDLLLGDFAAQNPDTPAPTPEEKVSACDALRAELN